MENDFEEEFRNDLYDKAKSESLHNQVAQSKKQRVAWVLVVVLAIVIVLETIVFSVIIAGYSNREESEDFEMTENDVTVEDFDVDVGEEYDEDGNIVSIKQKCIADSGEKYIFAYDKKYQHYNADGSLVDAGNFDLVNGSLIAIKNEDETSVELVLYYDGDTVADGLVLFSCNGGQ